MLVQGMITGAVGITFAHELMHQKTKLERFFSDILMAMAFYGHFRTEHVFVHHRYVGTKKDAVTARFNESFYTFFLRVIPQCLISAWSVEAQKLASKNKSILNICRIGMFLCVPVIRSWRRMGYCIIFHSSTRRRTSLGSCKLYRALWSLQKKNIR